MTKTSCTVRTILKVRRWILVHSNKWKKIFWRRDCPKIKNKKKINYHISFVTKPFVIMQINSIVTYPCILSLSQISLMGVNSSIRNSFCFSLLNLLLKLKENNTSKQFNFGSIRTQLTPRNMNYYYLRYLSTFHMLHLIS